MFLSWVCTVVAINLSMGALQRISAFTVNLTYNLEPAYGIFLAFIIYHENSELDASFYTGLMFIIIAVLLQTLRVYRRMSDV